MLRLRCRDGGRLHPHPFDRAKGSAGQQPSTERDDRQGHRPRHGQQQEQPSHGFVSIPQRGPDHDEQSCLGLAHRQQPNGIVHPAHPGGEERRQRTGRRGQLGGCEHRCGGHSRAGVDDRRGRVEDLGEGLVGIDEVASRLDHGGILAVDRGRDDLGPGPQVQVDPLHEVRAQPRVHERPEACQHGGHANREGQRQPGSDRQAHGFGFGFLNR